MFVFVTYFFVSAFMNYSYAYLLDPTTVERDEEKSALYKMYTVPMDAISEILEDGLKHCDRLPDEKEFRDFIIKGPNPSIRCSQAINLKPKITIIERGYTRGPENNIDLQEFLKKHKLQIYSNTKTLYAILKQDPKDWSSKFFKAHEYDLLVHCDYRINQCDLGKLDQRKKSCRNNPSFGRNFCYLGDKKVIDYD